MNNKNSAHIGDYNIDPAQETGSSWDMSGLGWNEGADSVETIDDRSVSSNNNGPIVDDTLEKESKKRPSIKRIRQIHIDYLSGNYEPSAEEWTWISQDDDFYDSEEYLAYRKKEVDNFADTHEEIYSPPDEKIERSVGPFIKKVDDDIEGLLKVTNKLEKDEVTQENVYEIVTFFAEKFEISDIPKLELIYDYNNKDTLGKYRANSNIVFIMPDSRQSIAGMISTIAHEVWHARQHQREAICEDYKVNFEYYYSSNMDYDAYCDQLVEKEASSLGNAIGALYRNAVLDRDPRKMALLNDLYFDWINGEYEPNGVSDGIEAKDLILAHKKYVEYNKFSNILKRIFRREKR